MEGVRLSQGLGFHPDFYIWLICALCVDSEPAGGFVESCRTHHCNFQALISAVCRGFVRTMGN